ncbi:MAG: UbiA-like polyprenyltransferase [Rikenellaceae bacterium]
MIKRFLSLIKFSHTLFAMPFALVGYALGVRDFGFDYITLVQVILCMVFARSAAMGFNRIVDREWDAKNPRTASREIPSGQISTTTVAYLVALCCVLFILTTLTINTLCFLLSPVALAVALGYSYTKRFTRWAHVVLGLALSFAPIGAYAAVGGSFSLLPALFSVLVIGWVAGFDIIFSVQDREFDIKEGLHSIPSKFGVRGALAISSSLHFIASAVAVVIGFFIKANMPLYWIGVGLFVAILFYEHVVVRPSKLDKINMAFATLNSMASILYGTFTVLSLFC